MNHLLMALVRWLRARRKVPSCGACRYANTNGALLLCGHPEKAWEIAAYEREHFVDYNLPDGKCGPAGELYEPVDRNSIDGAELIARLERYVSRESHEPKVTP